MVFRFPDIVFFVIVTLTELSQLIKNILMAATLYFDRYGKLSEASSTPQKFQISSKSVEAFLSYPYRKRTPPNPISDFYTNAIFSRYARK